jgi:choline dehydrogenase-like flavoprotein
MSSFDVVIVGSGAGGSPVAAHLAESGAKVLVIERGKRYESAAYDRDEIEWCRRDRFVPSPRTDPHTRRGDEGMNARPTTDGWISTIVGGGTVHMGGYFLRADPADAKQKTRLAAEGGHSAIDWAVPFEEIEKLYPVVEKETGVSGAPAPLKTPPLPDHPIAAKVEKAARARQLDVIPTPRGILTAPRPEDKRRACTYHDLCASYGCPDDAKASTAVTYLRRAERTGNLTLWAEARALEVLVGADGQASGVKVQRKGQPPEDVTAKIVVVACGAIESARLLLLSDPRLNPNKQVGRNLWFSLFVEATGFFDKDKHKDVQHLMAGSPFLNRTVMPGGHLPPARQKEAGVDRSGTLQVNFVHDNPIHRAERVATEGGLLWGAKLKQALHKSFRGGRTVIVEGFGESVPHAGAYVDLDPRVRDSLARPAARITYFHHPRDQKVAKAMAADMRALLEGMGADDVAITRPIAETTVLQGGTCRFGDDPKTSATAPEGHLHGVSNVYVTDGGSLPSSTAVPITLTILANATRIAGHIKKRLGA